MKLLLQTWPDLVHPRTGLAGTGYFKHRFPDCHALALHKSVNAKTADSDIFLDLARLQTKGVKRLTVDQKHLPATALSPTLTPLQAVIGERYGRLDFAHRTARSGR